MGKGDVEVLARGHLRIADHVPQRARYVLPGQGCCEIAEPHVGHLMEDGVGTLAARALGDTGPEQVALVERHATRILHGTHVEFGNEELVVLLERIGNAEERLVILEALLGGFEDLVLLQILEHRSTAVQTQLDGLAGERAHVRVGHVSIRAGDCRVEVGRKRFGGLEMMRGATVFGGLIAQFPIVAHHSPFRWGGHREGGLRLDVGLVETGEYHVGIEWLEVGVEIDLTVSRILDAMEPHSVAVVLGLTHNLELVAAGLEVVELDALAIEARSRELAPVEPDLVHLALKVDEGRSAVGGIEGGHGGGAVDLAGEVIRQVQVDRVLDVRD